MRHGRDGHGDERSGRRRFDAFGAGGDFGGLGNGHGSRGDGRGSRRFDGDDLRLVLLKLIAEAPRHGYDLIKAIEAMTGGSYAPSPGVVYPSLTLLHDMEMIEEQPCGGARKRFAVTAAGKARLADTAEQVAVVLARLTAMGREHQRADRAPVRRAMANLRFAVQERVFRDDLDPETAHAIAAVIDDAAQIIERLK